MILNTDLPDMRSFGPLKYYLRLYGIQGTTVPRCGDCWEAILNLLPPSCFVSRSRPANLEPGNFRPPRIVEIRLATISRQKFINITSYSTGSSLSSDWESDESDEPPISRDIVGSRVAARLWLLSRSSSATLTRRRHRRTLPGPSSTPPYTLRGFTMEEMNTRRDGVMYSQ